MHAFWQLAIYIHVELLFMRVRDRTTYQKLPASQHRNACKTVSGQFRRNTQDRRVASQVMDAILADSVKSGGRTSVYTVLFSVTILSLAVGQFAAAGIFLLSGNQCANLPSEASRWQ